MPPRPTLLLTRPEAASRRFAGLFRVRFGDDWPVVISPLTVITFRDGPLPGEAPQAVVFTSEAGVAAWVRVSPARPAAWCVGPRTAAAAQAAGFVVKAGPGDANGLAREIADADVAGPVLHIHGTEVSGDITGALQARGLMAREIVLYDQVSVPLAVEALTLLAGKDPLLLPLFSPASARRAAAAMPPGHAPLLIAAISPAVADAAAVMRPVRLGTAARPNAEAMLDALSCLVADAGTA
jgi:uroporphyrinogen-III synthase